MYIVLLNNDIEIIDPWWLNLAVRIMKKFPHVGVIGFNLVLPSGGPQQYGHLAYASFVDEVSFAAVVVRGEVFAKIGFLDPMYVRGYAEDTDFCYRALNSGYKILYLPYVRIRHIGMGTFGKIRRELIYSLGAYNSVTHFILNWSVRKFLIFLGVGVLKGDLNKRLKWLLYGFLIRLKSHGLFGIVELFCRKSCP